MVASIFLCLSAALDSQTQHAFSLSTAFKQSFLDLFFSVPRSLIIFIVGIVSVWTAWTTFITMRMRNMPPGPRGLPLLGNLLDLPVERPWLQLEKWKQHHGVSQFPSAISSTNRIPQGRFSRSTWLVNRSWLSVAIKSPQICLVSTIRARGTRIVAKPFLTSIAASTRSPS